MDSLHLLFQLQKPSYKNFLCRLKGAIIHINSGVLPIKFSERFLLSRLSLFSFLEIISSLISDSSLPEWGYSVFLFQLQRGGRVYSVESQLISRQSLAYQSGNNMRATSFASQRNCQNDRTLFSQCLLKSDMMSLPLKALAQLYPSLDLSRPISLGSVRILQLNSMFQKELPSAQLDLAYCWNMILSFEIFLSVIPSDLCQAITLCDKSQGLAVINLWLLLTPYFISSCFSNPFFRSLSSRWLRYTNIGQVTQLKFL